MYPYHFSYPPQLAYHLHQAVYPTPPEGGAYNNNWGTEQVNTLLNIANEMNVEPASTGVAATANNGSYQCRWLAGGIPCSQGFANFDDLIVHAGRVHDVQGPAGRKMVCQWQMAEGWHCGKECRRDGFRRHIGTHVSLSVPCPVCGKPYSREDSMRAHWKKHFEKA